jgi:hypothetical protein
MKLSRRKRMFVAEIFLWEEVEFYFWEPRFEEGRVKG